MRKPHAQKWGERPAKACGDIHMYGLWRRVCRFGRGSGAHNRTATAHCSSTFPMLPARLPRLPRISRPASRTMSSSSSPFPTTRPANWKSNTAIAFAGIFVVAYGVFTVSADKEVRTRFPSLSGRSLRHALVICSGGLWNPSDRSPQ